MSTVGHFKLRPYQDAGVASLYDYFSEKDGNPIVAMPTGSGKSVVIAAFLKSIFDHWPRQKVMVLTHVKKLISQNYEKLLSIWPDAPAGINSAGLKQRDVFRPIIFAGIGSVANHAEKFGHVDLVIIDEAHLVSPKSETMYRKFIAALKKMNPKLKVIGFTATPWRMKQGSLTAGDNIFTDVAYDCITGEAILQLIEQGYLSMLIPKRTETAINLDNVRTVNGDFSAEDLSVAVSQNQTTERALAEAIALGRDRKCWIVFCSGIAHAERTADLLTHMGIDTRCVHSGMAAKDVDAAIEALASGQIQALTNSDMLTTGIDIPQIDIILMLRPTKSSALWVQMLGRGMRVAEGKTECLVLDYARNTERLGPINDPVIPNSRKGSGSQSGAPVKSCPVCLTYNHAAARVCISCNYEFPAVDAAINETADNRELIANFEIVPPEIVRVDYIAYDRHRKLGRPDSIAVSYACDIKTVREFVCFEHGGYPSRMARDWWSRRANAARFENGLMIGDSDPIPSTTDEALSQTSRLAEPKYLKILKTSGYYQILDVCFDSSAFGTITPGSEPARIDRAAVKAEYVDDDIPF